MKLNHTLTKEECDGLIGIILPKSKDDVDMFQNQLFIGFHKV